MTDGYFFHNSNIPTEDDLAFSFSRQALRDCYETYKLSKTDVFDKSIKIPSGTDGIAHQEFEKNIDRHLDNIGKRVLEGRYFFHPMREFDIPKVGGGTRTLAIASIRDAIVQRQIYRILLPSCETIFRSIKIEQDVSFAYRKGKSAAMAARRI